MHLTPRIILFILVLSRLVLLHAQQAVMPAPEHFARFNNVEGGWLASDATISLALPDGNALWLFGDCIIGEESAPFVVANGKSKMINNAAILEHDGVLSTCYQGTTENPSSFIPGEGIDIFWPEHGILENDTLKIFAIQIIYQNNGTPGFDFRIGTTHLAYYKYPEIEYIKTEEVKYITDTTMRFGAHVLKKEDYTYIFGVKDTVLGGYKYPVPMLARVDSSVDEPWQFYAGDGNWSFSCAEAVPVGDRPMSESFFVYEKNGKYYLIMHEIWLVGELYLLEADNLTGPWNRASSGGTEKKFCVIRKPAKNMTYNLFAHPQFMKDDRVLISFNVNHSDFWPIFSDTRNYRARFLWLSIDEAMAATAPDTMDINEIIVGTADRQMTDSRHPVVRTDPQHIYIDQAGEGSELRIFGIDGREYYHTLVNGSSVLSRDKFPRSVLLIQVISNRQTFISRIYNTQ
jgi:hypothetical protein